MLFRSNIVLACSVVALSLSPAMSALAYGPTRAAGSTRAADQDKAPQESAYSFSLVDMDGNVVPLSRYKGKVLLVVNLASESEYSGQIAGLNDLAKKYADQGLVVVGIPSAEFGDLEVKDATAVRKQYQDALHVAFPVFSRATLTGVHAIPLMEFLCDPKTGLPGGPLHWNFTKFLIGRDGKPLARYEVSVNPTDPDFEVQVESALDGKWKKPGGKSDGKADAANDGDDDDR